MDNASLRAFLDASPAADIRKMLAAHPDMEAMISYISDDRSPQTQVFRKMWKLSRAFHTMRRRSGRSDKGVLYRHGFAEALIFCNNAAPSEQLPHYHPVKNKKRLDKFR